MRGLPPAIPPVFTRDFLRRTLLTAFTAWLTCLWFACGLASAQNSTGSLTLEQAGSRTGRDAVAVYEGRSISVRAQVAGDLVWALDTYYLPLRDSTDHGLVLR